MHQACHNDHSAGNAVVASDVLMNNENLESKQSYKWRNTLSVIRDSVLVLFFVAGFAALLSSVEGMIENQRTQPVYAEEQAFLHNLFGVKTAEAASYNGLDALAVSIPGNITMEPGETKTITVRFQNIGTKTWQNSGSGFVSIYTHGPKYRESSFEAASWTNDIQPAVLNQVSVKPGATGSLTFALTAPQTTGSYSETFHLASEDTAWIDGGSFTLSIKVQNQPTSSSGVTTSHQGAVVMQSANAIKARGGASILFTVGVKNTGSTTWGERSLTTRDYEIASSAVDFYHAAWVSDSIVSTRSDAIAPGEIDYFTFGITAPSEAGEYTAQFSVSVGGESIEGAEITLPVEVTQDAPDAVSSPRVVDPAPESDLDEDGDGIIENIILDEPTIRIGVLIVDGETDDYVSILAEESDMKVRDINGNVLANVDEGVAVKAFYSNGAYYYDVGRGLERSSYGIRFIPEDENTVLTITNFDRRLTRNAGHADNQFRNILEIRYNSENDRTWMINELPVEYYLRGLAETSNISHQEFKKTLLTAARTYAYYHWQRATKHAEEYFHMNSSADDQVYKGYGYELRTPLITEAVEDTRGVTVTYDGETAITPYFSRSDGRTRDWGEVWYGDVPWAKSVSVPCDVGKTLWGHGVGMSASGALCMANDGDTYEEILTHFYTGIDLEKRWE